MGFNIWKGKNKNLFQFDGWKKIEAKKYNQIFILNGWGNRAPSEKYSKVSINGWKNSIIK